MTNPILIVDAGATKTDWIALNAGAKGSDIAVNTSGINAVTTPEDAIHANVSEACKLLSTGNIGNTDITDTKADETHISAGDIAEVWYYGAGCAAGEACERMRIPLVRSFPNAEVHVASDLLGAARALCGDSRGIACILGTGSNSCLYDGKEIVANTPSLGFILGDEGSGAVLGKRLVADFLKGCLPNDIADIFRTEYDLTISEAIERVYRQPGANRWLASFVPFLKRHITHPSIRELLTDEFTRFFRRNISQYPESRNMPVNFTGGVAYAFSDLLQEVASQEGYRVGVILRSPLAGLIDYHRNR